MPTKTPKLSRHKPHDSYFKLFFSYPEIAMDLLQKNLPSSFLKHCDLTQLVTVPNEFLSSSGQVRFADLVYRAPFTHNQSHYAYFLIEHQSKPDKQLPKRLWHYTQGLLDAHQRQITSPLPIIIPIVVYTGKAKYRYSLDYWDSFVMPDLAKAVMMSPAKMIDVYRSEDAPHNTQAPLDIFAYLQKHQHDRSLEQLMIGLEQRLEHITLPLDLKVASWQYIFNTKELFADPNAFYEFVSQHLANSKETLMTLADQLIEKGIEQGREQGIEQGIEQGRLAERRATLNTMRNAGISLEEISRYTQLSIAEIQSLLQLDTQS